MNRMNKIKRTNRPNDSNEPDESSAVAEAASEGQKNNTERKIQVLRRLSSILIILGILGILLPFFNSFLLARNSDIDLSSLSGASMQKAMENAEMVPFNEIKEVGFVNFWPLLGKWQAEDIAAELHIPSLDIALAIFNSASNTNLLAGAGLLFADRHMEDTNFVITGHRVQGKGVLLHSLMDAELGKSIYVTDKENIYVYRIVDMQEKDTSALYMLDESRNEDYAVSSIISIMTCYQGRSSSRWFVIGALEEVIPYDEALLSREYSFE